MRPEILLLGVDGGGTKCRARLSTFASEILGEAESGPANLRRGVAATFAAVFEAVTECLDRAGLSPADLARISACLALAGASEPAQLAAAQARKHPFRTIVITTDAHAACVGAHGQGEGQGDGGVIVAGTGSVGWAMLKGRTHRVGGWGLPISDEGSGAWIGCEALRRVLWAFDGRIPWSPLLRVLFADFSENPHAIVRWTQHASPRDFGSLVRRVVEYAAAGDAAGGELLDLAAGHIDALAAGLLAAGVTRLALVGGCAPFLQPRLSQQTRSHLVEPAGDALHGALQLARSAASSRARVA